MGKTASGSVQQSGSGSGTKKRSLPPGGPPDSAEQSSKKLLSANKFASLSVEEIQKKEKLPPFYVKGPSVELVKHLNGLIAKGLQAELRLLSDGVKITVPTSVHYKTVSECLQVMKVEYFTHDVASEKPFKVVLRGLPETDTKEVLDALKHVNLKPVEVFKMRRHNQTRKYRDQLYLVHLAKGSTTLAELKNVRALNNIIIEWERYKPVHRDVTQCGNCLYFGHGTKHCHLKSRCSKCGNNHQTSSCEIETDTTVPCVNCGQEHSSTSRTCPKRGEFIHFRKEVAQRTRPKPRKERNIIEDGNFPDLTNGLPPPPPPPRKTATSPPGFRSYADAANATPEAPYSMDQLAFLFSELDRQTRACRTNNEQVAVMMRFYYQHRSILSATA